MIIWQNPGITKDPTICFLLTLHMILQYIQILGLFLKAKFNSDYPRFIYFEVTCEQVECRNVFFFGRSTIIKLLIFWTLATSATAFNIAVDDIARFVFSW